MSTAKKRAVVAGGAGFIGSHLCEALLAKGLRVLCVDNLLTGRESNIAHLQREKNFSFQKQDVTLTFEISGEVDFVLNLASPASPVDYQKHPLETLKVGAFGSWNLLELARQKKARYLLASTSEVYGDPKLHPQTESYWGNVNPIGPRSCYDESKRYAEALTIFFAQVHGVDVAIARIFNTYGPRMQLTDGRALPNFVPQALRGQPLTVYGDGSQTRSFCYVSDMVAGLLGLLFSKERGPINLGNPHEISLLEFAKMIVRLTRSKSEIVFQPLPKDDPKQRRPDITKAKEILGWAPTVSLEEGLKATIPYFAQRL